jgi:hypothetical protein
MRQESFPNELKKQAWEKMNEILDEELPQKKRKLRFLFFLFPIILIIGFVLFKAVYANNLDEKKVESEKSVEFPSRENIYRKSPKKLKNNNGITIANDGQPKNKKHSEFIFTKPDKALTIDNQLTKTVIDISIKPEQILPTGIEPSSIAKANVKRNSGLTNQLPNYFVFEEIQPLKSEDFLPIPLEIQKPVNRNNWYFHPYCGIKLYNSAIEGLNLTSEISVGNILYLNNRFLLDFSFSYTNPKILYSTVEVFDNNYDISNKLNEFANESSQISNLQNIKYNIFEFSFHESYRLSRIVTISAGGGVALTKKMNSLLKNEENFPSEYSEVDLIKPVTFLSDINIQYNLTQKLTFLLGYKYYFKNYSVFKDVEAASLRSAYLKKESKLMNFYLGMRYDL